MLEVDSGVPIMLEVIAWTIRTCFRLSQHEREGGIVGDTAGEDLCVLAIQCSPQR